VTWNVGRDVQVQETLIAGPGTLLVGLGTLSEVREIRLETWGDLGRDAEVVQPFQGHQEI
jgi:hypothetical protein